MVAFFRNANSRCLQVKQVLLYVAIMALVTLAGVECALRIYIWATGRSLTASEDLWQPHPLRGFAHKPNQDVITHKWTVKINSHGFRGPDFPRMKPANEFRILALGGSATYGYQLSEGETWPDQLQALLKERGLSRIRVINGGVLGYTSFESLAMCIDEAAAFQVDLVVFAELWNDAKYFRRRFPGEGDQFRYADFRPGFDPRQGRSWMERNLVLVRYWDAIWNRISPPKYTEEAQLGVPSTQAGPPRNTPVYFRNLRFMNQVLKSSGIGFAVIQQPWLFKQHNTAEESRRMNLNYIKTSANEAADYADWLYERLAIESQQSGYHYFSVEPFPRDLEHFQDHVHLTSKGAQLYAKLICDALLSHDVLDDMRSSHIDSRALTASVPRGPTHQTRVTPSTGR